MATILADNLDALARRYGFAPALAQAPSRSPLARSSPDLAVLAAGLTTPWPATVCGIGIGVAGLLDRPDAADGRTRLLVIEPDAGAARALLEHRSWIDDIARGRFALLVGPDFGGLAGLARAWPDIAQAPVLVDPALVRDRPDAERMARAALARLTFQNDANSEARRALAGRYLLHTLGNLPRLMREGDAARLSGAFTGVPAIIAAAGPSLDRNLHDIAPALDRAVLIACDTAALPLITAGVTPHLAVAVDASEGNARHLSSLPPTPMALVTEGSVHPSALQAFGGRTFFFKVSEHDPWPWLDSLGLDRGRLDAWGSVATTAFALALEMGCNPIVFAGADFAFTDGRPYCRGTSLEPMWTGWMAGGFTEADVWRIMLDRWVRQDVIDLRGAPTSTAPHLIAFRDWIVDRAAARRDRLVVNATGAGLLAGSAIAQRSVADALANAAPLAADAVSRTLRERHTVPDIDHASVLAAATSLVAGLDTAVLERWHLFTSGRITAQAMRAALASPEQQAFALGLGLRPRAARIAS